MVIDRLLELLPDRLNQRFRGSDGAESSSVRDAVLADRERSARDRAEREAQIPRVPLSEEHIRNCELVLDRRVLLSRLPRRAIVAEIGVDRGDFSQRILETAQPRRLHLIDPWGTDRFHSGLVDEVTRRFQSSIDCGAVQIHRERSTEAAADFPENYFDWIYLDTDHSYETTRDELWAYVPKMKADGIIAGHDYAMGNWVRSYRYGVIEAVHEFCVEAGWELVHLTLEPIELQSFAIRRVEGSR